MITELTIQEACSHAADFMYIWADEKQFLRYIKSEYASNIRLKKAHQKKLLELSAEKYGKTVSDYTTAIREAFIDEWGHTPVEALVILAQGGQIAGKNWVEGVYGVGALHTNVFNGTNITVDEKNGHIMKDGTDYTDTTKTVYATVKNKPVEYQLFATIDGVTYMSQYQKISKKYFAQSYSNAEGTFNARTGGAVSASDNADIWGSILLSFDKFLNWLVSLFGGSTERQTLTTENTLPDQKTDGFVSQSGMGEAGMILLALAGGGLLLANAKKKNSK